MKSLTLLSILVVSVLCISVVVQARNKTWGDIGYNDYLLATDYITRPAGFSGTVVVDYPPKRINHATITAIKAWDHGGRKKRAFAKFLDGGPSHRDAAILLTSYGGRGLNFTIQYFGH